MKSLNGSSPLQVLAPQLNGFAPHELREFWKLWREEKFFECHEVLEVLWRRERGANKILLNALIHCAVAIYQHRRDNAIGAVRQLLRAQSKFALVDDRVICKYLQMDWRALISAIESEIAFSLAQISAEEKARWPQLKASIEKRMRRELERP